MEVKPFVNGVGVLVFLMLYKDTEISKTDLDTSKTYRNIRNV